MLWCTIWAWDDNYKLMSTLPSGEYHNAVDMDKLYTHIHLYMVCILFINIMYADALAYVGHYPQQLTVLTFL